MSQIVGILDESGSMFEIRDGVLSGFNELLDNQRRINNHKGDFTSFQKDIEYLVDGEWCKYDEDNDIMLNNNGFSKNVKFDPNIKYRSNNLTQFTLIKFNTNISVVWDKEHLRNIPKFTEEHYNPDGLTALYDAIGKGIELHKDNENVIFIIITDGEENSSKKYKREEIFNKLEYLQKNKGWELMFIGANQDSFKSGGNIGVKNCVNYAFTPEGVNKVLRSCSDNICSYQTTGDMDDL